jgi:hypothetical protein
MPTQTIIRDADLIAQAFAASLLDAPDPDDCVEDVEESFCLACQLPAARFESLGGDLAHYAGDPAADNIQPYRTAHAPFLA